MKTAGTIREGYVESHHDILAFITREIDALGTRPRVFPCSAHLRDGTYLPCVEIKIYEEIPAITSGPLADPAVRLKTQQMSATQIAAHNIASLERSPFALPLEIYQRWPLGDLAHGFNGCWLQMRDGVKFPYRAVSDPPCETDERTLHPLP